jgi:hypothetical protein
MRPPVDASNYKKQLKKGFTFHYNFMDWNKKDTNLSSHVAFSDETNFNIAGSVNFQNMRIWETKNPHATETF